jgi:hypothetical protein
MGARDRQLDLIAHFAKIRNEDIGARTIDPRERLSFERRADLDASQRRTAPTHRLRQDRKTRKRAPGRARIVHGKATSDDAALADGLANLFNTAEPDNVVALHG